MSEACAHEPRIVSASRRDAWTDELRNHLRECEECAFAANVGPWMEQFARISVRQHILPDPSIVWLKARLLRGPIEASRAARPLDTLQAIAYLVVAGGWAALMTWKWAAVEAWVRTMTPSGMVQSAARAESLSMSLLAIVFVLASTTVLLAFHTILAED